MFHLRLFDTNFSQSSCVIDGAISHNLCLSLFPCVYASYIWLRFANIKPWHAFKICRAPKTNFHCFMHKISSRPLAGYSCGCALHFSIIKRVNFNRCERFSPFWKHVESDAGRRNQSPFLLILPIINRPAFILTTSLSAQNVCLNLSCCITPHSTCNHWHVCNIRCNLKNAIARRNMATRSEKILLVDSNYVNSRSFFSSLISTTLPRTILSLHKARASHL